MSQSHLNPENGRTFNVREVDLEKEIERRLTHLETREKYFSEEIPQISKKLENVESTTLVMRAVSESTKAQRNVVLATLGVAFGGASVVATIIKLFLMP